MKTTVFKSDTQLRKDAADIAAEIAGTKGVAANELTVHTPDRAHPSDTELASAVRHALKWDVNTPDEKIEVIVRHGVVTLKGAVDYWYEKTCAAECVMKITGVSAIDDQIAVLPPPVSDTDIGATIDKSIERRIPLAAAHQGPR
jgi:osmotically-inducible protein OsmY